MSEVKDRIIEFAKSQGFSIKSFEQACGMSNGYVAAMRKGLGTDKLNNVLSAFPSLNRDWLLYGEGPMLRPSTSVHHVSGNGIAVGNGNSISNSSNADTAEIIRKIDELTQHIIGLESLQKEQTARLLSIIERLTDNK